MSKRASTPGLSRKVLETLIEMANGANVQKMNRERTRLSKILMTVLRLGVLGIMHCCLSACSNEVINSVINSQEQRMAKFQSFHDQQIGEPYVGRESEVCAYPSRVCRPIDPETLEIEHRNTFEVGCHIAWTVKRSKTGKIIHPTNGLTLDIIGTKVSWRFLSDTKKCLYGQNWEGPW